MNILIENFRRKTKIYNHITLIISIMALICLFFSYQEAKVYKSSTSGIMDLCSDYKQEIQSLESLKDFCARAEKMLPILEAFSKVHSPVVGVHPDIGYKAVFWLFAACALLGLGLNFFELNRDTYYISKFFSLNKRETYLFYWINELKHKKIFKSENEFNTWIHEYRNLYSARDLEVMKLNFKI